MRERHWLYHNIVQVCPSQNVAPAAEASAERDVAISWRLAPAINVGDVRFRFEEMAPPTKEPNPVAAARGRRESPAFRGDEPLTSWKLSGVPGLQIDASASTVDACLHLPATVQ